MDKLVRFFRAVSWVLFLGGLLWTYAYLEMEVILGGMSFTKSTFFFLVLIIFVVTNAALMMLTGTLKKIKTSEEGQGIRNRNLKLKIMTWVHGLMGILNVFFLMVVLYAGYTNGQQEYQSLNVGFLFYVAPALLIGWFGYLAKLLSSKTA